MFGKRAGEYAAKFAREHNAASRSIRPTVQRAADDALKPFEHGQGKAENPYTIQSDLQEMMQRLVGIVRTESEMQRGADRSWRR